MLSEKVTLYRFSGVGPLLGLPLVLAVVAAYHWKVLQVPVVPVMSAASTL